MFPGGLTGILPSRACSAATHLPKTDYCAQAAFIVHLLLMLVGCITGMAVPLVAASELHPRSLESLGVGPALAKHVEEFSSRGTDIRVRFYDNMKGCRVPPEIALCLYRIAQEALRNIGRHSGADEVELRLDYHTRSFRLAIKDDGRGCEPDCSSGSAGLGLASREERVRIVNGELCIRSTQGGGMFIDVRVPDPFSHAES